MVVGALAASVGRALAGDRYQGVSLHIRWANRDSCVRKTTSVGMNTMRELKVCPNCGASHMADSSRCSACHVYRFRQGVERPEAVFVRHAVRQFEQQEFRRWAGHLLHGGRKHVTERTGGSGEGGGVADDEQLEQEREETTTEITRETERTTTVHAPETAED